MIINLLHRISIFFILKVYTRAFVLRYFTLNVETNSLSVSYKIEFIKISLLDCIGMHCHSAEERSLGCS